MSEIPETKDGNLVDLLIAAGNKVREQAATIERLRKALKDIKNAASGDDGHLDRDAECICRIHAKAHAALARKEPE